MEHPMSFLADLSGRVEMVSITAMLRFLTTPVGDFVPNRLVVFGVSGFR